MSDTLIPDAAGNPVPDNILAPNPQGDRFSYSAGMPTQPAGDVYSVDVNTGQEYNSAGQEIIAGNTGYNAANATGGGTQVSAAENAIQAAAATLPSTDGTDLNNEGETVLGTVGPSTPYQLAGENSSAPPLMVSAPPTPAPASATSNLFPYALLALIAGVVAYAAYMLYKHRAELEADI